jgi:hypothetical protein
LAKSATTRRRNFLNYTEAIYAQAEALLGEPVRDDRAAALTAMCEAAGTELENRLRDGVTAEELGSAFVSAAGVLALSMYIQLGDTSDIGSFKAGNVTVSLRGGDSRAASAASLRRQAELMLAAWLKDRGFDFMGVRG